MVPDSKWIYNTEFDWDDYYANPPEELFELAEEWKKRFDVSYENIFNGISNYKLYEVEYHQLHAPLQVVGVGHALEYVEGEWKLFDTYVPFLKDVDPKYGWLMNCCYKGIIKEREYSMDNIKNWIEGMYDELGWDKTEMFTPARELAIKTDSKLEGVNFAKAVKAVITTKTETTFIQKILDLFKK